MADADTTPTPEPEKQQPPETDAVQDKRAAKKAAKAERKARAAAKKAAEKEAAEKKKGGDDKQPKQKPQTSNKHMRKPSRRPRSRNPSQNQAHDDDDREKHRGKAMQFDDPKKYAKFKKKQVLQRTVVQKQVPLFSHLPQYERETSLSLLVGFSAEELHPSIIRLGLKYAEGAISGSNVRAVALLRSLKDFISDYKTPENALLSLDMPKRLQPLVRFLVDCRPMSISMGNTLRHVKMAIAKAPNDEDAAKKFLLQKIDDFIQHQILFADQIIAKKGAEKIQDGDCVLVYARSHVVEQTIIWAHTQLKKKFRVIVVDSRPKLEGKEMLKRLVAHRVPCTYILLNALSYVMQEVSKVFLGAHAMLANGTCLSRVGCAVVGMMAHTYNVPLLVLCETYKFSEQSKLDSICYNELGDPDDLIRINRDDSRYGDVLTDWRDIPKLKLLNLLYDLTPANFITMVITEVGEIPPTSVPVILREYHKDQIQ